MVTFLSRGWSPRLKYPNPVCSPQIILDVRIQSEAIRCNIAAILNLIDGRGPDEDLSLKDFGTCMGHACKCMELFSHSLNGPGSYTYL